MLSGVVLAVCARPDAIRTRHEFSDLIPLRRRAVGSRSTYDLAK